MAEGGGDERPRATPRTLHGERADRVPISPFLYYNAIYEMFDYVPEIETFFDPPGIDVIAKFVEYCDHFGFDILHSLGSSWDFWAARSTQADRTILRMRTAGTWRSRTSGGTTGCGGPSSSPHPAGAPPRRGVPAHLEVLIVCAPEEYSQDAGGPGPPPAVHAARGRMDCSIRGARLATGERGLVASCTNGAFNQAAIFRNVEDLMTDPIVDEGFYRDMMEFFVAAGHPAERQLIESGADVIEVGGNLAGSTVGPAFFQRHVMDYESRIIDAIHARGRPGDLPQLRDAARVMHLYNEMDIDCLGYLAPPPFGDVDLDEALRVLRPDDGGPRQHRPGRVHGDATPDEVRERVRELMEKVKPRGNLILSTTDFFFDGTPYENIEAFASSGRDFGVYAG